MEQMWGLAGRPTLAIVWILMSSWTVHAQSVTVVNMIPVPQSFEFNSDSEPNLAVNPANPLQIAASAFTPDYTGLPNVAPIYVSPDGGMTWTLSPIIPLVPGNNCIGTCDITLRFSGSSDTLYVSWLDRVSSMLMTNVGFHVARVRPFSTPSLFTVLQSPTYVFPNIRDQPYIQASTVIGGAGTGNDRAYIGVNDLSVRPRTATIVQSLDVGTPPAPAGLMPMVVERRNTCGQDAPSVRSAIHPGGTIYTAFFHLTSCSPFMADVVIVRDDNWGAGTDPYSALLDLPAPPNDGVAGVRVVLGIPLPTPFLGFPSLGRNRIGSSLSIAVDPNDSQTVYLAWADGSRFDGSDYTIRVRRSTAGGAAGTWSDDLKTVTQATNPALAINNRGKVGFLYQKLTGPAGSQRWETHFETTTDGFTTSTNLLLANVPDNVGDFPLGDYDHVLAVGKDFYGIFSANNFPDLANFPSGAIYPRYHDFTTHQLFADAAHTMVVNNASVDPFFFHVTEQPPEQDFYVRDWSNSLTSHDAGQEPSTNPDFYSTSDVWNRQPDNTAGTFDPVTDRPDEQLPQEAGSGHNYAYTRIGRKAAPVPGSPDVAVMAEFLYADFGLGTNYNVLGSAAPLTFHPSDTLLTIPDGSGLQWDLPTGHSTHLCLAVELSAPGDPLNGDLLGNAPGWGAALMIWNDNNKAQRNIDFPLMVQESGTQRFAIVHNAATSSRSVVVGYQVDPEVLKKMRGARVEVVGGKIQPLKSQGTLVLEKMAPGENRWIGLTIEGTKGKRGETLPIHFTEVVNGTAVNGFAIAARVSPLGAVIQENLKFHRAVFDRLAEAFGIERGRAEALAAKQLLKQKEVSSKNYLAFLALHEKPIMATLVRLMESRKSQDPFGAREALKTLESEVRSGRASRASGAHDVLLQKFDAFQTMLQKDNGDAADILQMVRWQRELYANVAKLRQLKASEFVVGKSQEFIRDFAYRKKGVDDYPHFIAELMESFRETAEALDKEGQLIPEIAQMGRDLKSPAPLEKDHRNYLLKLQNLAK